MNSPIHGFSELFSQLGLPSDKASVDKFVISHRPLASDVKLAEAPFWNESQASFLKNQLAHDADWSMVIDTLDARLREH